MRECEEKKPIIKFDNHVSIGHIFTTLSILIAGVGYAVNIENRVSYLEKYDQVIEKRIEENRVDYREALQEIKVSLKSIENKIDQKADKR